MIEDLRSCFRRFWPRLSLGQWKRSSASPLAGSCRYQSVCGNYQNITVQEVVISLTDHGHIDGRPCKSIIGHTPKSILRSVGRLLCGSCNWSGQSSSKRTREHRHIKEANAIFKEHCLLLNYSPWNQYKRHSGDSGWLGMGARVETQTSDPICEFQWGCSLLPTIILSFLTVSGSGQSQQTTNQDICILLICLEHLTYRILFSEKKENILKCLLKFLPAYWALMGDSSRLTPLSTVCKQPGPVIWFPLFLSLASQLSIASFVWRNLFKLWP